MIHQGFSLVVAGCWLALIGSTKAHAASPFSESDVPLFKNQAKVFYRLPSMLVTSKGTVLAACQKRVGESGDFAPSDLVLRRSCDGGKTFEQEQTLFARDGDCCFNGNLVEDRQSGTIFACFIAFPQAERKTWFQQKWFPQGGGFSMVKSSDDGKIWSPPIDVMPAPNADGWHGGGAFNNNHGVQLQRGPHAGRLIIGARVVKAGVYEARGKGGLIYSDDHGATWHVGGVMLKNLADINTEISLGETGDGEAYVNSRNGLAKKGSAVPEGFAPHQRIYSRSRDGGESFYQEGCHAELFDGPCNAGQALLANGLMLFTAPPVSDRTHLTAYLSADNGRSWKTAKVISELAGGYSDDAVTEDGTILTLYENGHDKTKPHGLLLARYNVEWLQEKK